MRRIHLAAGVLALLIFAATGQVMLRHAPPMGSLGDANRLLYRSRHIYILAAGLINLMLGLYMRPPAYGWRAGVRNAGSLFLLIAPGLLVTAFFVETARGFHPEMFWSSSGVYALLAGSILHAAAADLSSPK